MMYLQRFADIAVVISGGKETMYDSIQDAINAAPQGATVKLLANINTQSEIYVLRNSAAYDLRNLILDLNGHTINYTESKYAVTIGKDINFTLKDSSAKKDGKIISKGSGIKNESTLIVESGNINASGNGVDNTGTFIQNGGTVTGQIINKKKSLCI